MNSRSKYLIMAVTLGVVLALTLLGLLNMERVKTVQAAPLSLAADTLLVSIRATPVLSEAYKINMTHPRLAVTSTVAAIAANPPGWTIECVDCPKYFETLTDRSLRLDSAGHPAIAYGGDHLYYAWNDGSTWHLTTVDNSPRVEATPRWFWMAAIILTSVTMTRRTVI